MVKGINMHDAIKNFAKQFEFEPVIQNAEKLRRTGQFIVLGMGGSHLTADLLEAKNPCWDIIVHKNYGLPPVSENTLKNSLVIASSYSGDTEEVIDGFKEALRENLSVAAVATGGELLKLAYKRSIPYVELPDAGIQPRSALGYSIKALARLMGFDDEVEKLTALSCTLKPEEYEEKGKMFAEKLQDKVPIIYASSRNEAVAYNWKIKFNETGKIPAFYNVFPELNHNEMTGFDVKDSSRHLSRNFFFIILQDADDHPQIVKRMRVLIKLFQNRGLPAEAILLEGEGRYHKIFSSLALADWTAYYSAERYGLESEAVPMVEEFKTLV